MIKTRKTAIKETIRREGGLVDHPNDPGGITKFGISLRYLKSEGDLGDFDRDGDIDADDVRGMTEDQAVEIYEQIWDEGRYDELPPEIAGKVFDLEVNTGRGRAVKILQQACRASGPKITVDGILGPVTRHVASSIPPDELLAAIRVEAASFYRRLVAARPSLEVFLKGWLRRAYDEV